MQNEKFWFPTLENCSNGDRFKNIWVSNRRYFEKQQEQLNPYDIENGNNFLIISIEKN